jgi:hypothetical protein
MLINLKTGNKTGVLKMNKIIFLASLAITVGYAIGSANNLDCPSAKLKPQNACDSLANKNDQDFILTEVSMLRTENDPELHPEQSDSLKAWTAEMFTKYDFRSYLDTAVRKSTPSDSQLEWTYQYLEVRKSDLADLMSERYVNRLWLTYLPTTSGIHSFTNPKLRTRTEAEVDIRGRIYTNPGKKSSKLVKFKILEK